MRASSSTLSSRTLRLTASGFAAAFLLWLTASTITDMLDAGSQIVDLKASYASSVAQASTARPDVPPSGPLPDRGLVAPGREAAISLIQHTMQQLVEAPARLESLHILDAPDENGLVVVRASLRIRGLTPERVAAFVHRIEGTVPAVLFDDLRVSIHTKPGVFGASGPVAGAETNTAEIGGIVRAYAMGAIDRRPSEPAEPQPR